MHEGRDGGTGPVVVGVDGSRDADLALRWACEEAARRGVDVVAVIVVPVHPAAAAPSASAPVDEAEALLRLAIGRLGPSPAPIRPTVLCAPPAPGLRAEAHRQEGSLLVVGRRGTARFSRMLVGSVSTALAHNPSLPLVVVPDLPPVPTGQLRRVLVGVDGSDGSLAALRWAGAEAAGRGAHIDVLTVRPTPLGGADDPDPAPFGGVTGALRSLSPGDGDGVSVEEVEGDTATSLLQRCTGHDLVVVGASRPGSLRRRVFGSVSQAMARHAPVPAVIVPLAYGAGQHRPSTLAAVS